MTDKQNRKIAFQGEAGAFSHQACREVYPDMEPLACPTFEAALEAVHAHEAELAMMPIENSLYGRVADLHRLLPDSGLYAIGEHFVPIRLQLLGLPGAKLEDITEAQTHMVALGQCRKFLGKHNIAGITGADTAGSAREVRDAGLKHRAAISSALAGDIYGLENVAADIEDMDHNTTRFLVLSRRRIESDPTEGRSVTSFLFEVRNVPAALYKAMGGFATNGVNMNKLESFMLGGSFTATRFYAEIEGHPADPAVERALEELQFFCKSFKIMGVFPMHPRRLAGEASV
ncbi:prephenate dehydratase [Rhodobacteraceae bacterium NNCM2]|nr:prephenate dehydratase [Coraliihabitans acroporae]